MNLFFFMALVMLISTALTCCNAKRSPRAVCPPSACGNVKNISYPFRLSTDPKHCGHPDYELECENNQTLLTTLGFCRGSVQVQSVNYADFTFRLLYTRIDYTFETLPIPSQIGGHSTGITFVWCEAPKESTSTNYVNATFLTNPSALESSLSSRNDNFYAFAHDDVVQLESLENGCTIMGTVLVCSDAPFLNGSRMASSSVDVGEVLSYGFQLAWDSIFSRGCRRYCHIPEQDIQVSCWHRGFCEKDVDDIHHEITYSCRTFRFPWPIWVAIVFNVATTTGLILGPRFVCGFICLLIFVVYKLRRRHLSSYETIEDFLHGNNTLIPIRYNYSQIKQMTKKFQYKIGEGGYGTVYRGTLRSGIVVAVKMMAKSMACGQDFMSEVATIGRIHHINVVQLIGYCAQGSKRALVYEFMPNGSLEKHIFSREESIPLSWEKVFHIAVGVARGIDYLHRGCDVRILHFDIKPHNILLDDNFVPKISDFGLAKLYRTDDSIISLTAARGTMGYMAPELFYKNIGGISHKADVYSFGMMLMEMVGKRKNVNPFVEQVSQIYFPNWVYDQYAQGKEIEMQDVSEDERKTVKKIIITALWCIQLRPDNRPSMSKVIDMLEGEIEHLQMPPKPSISPGESFDDYAKGDANDSEEALYSCLERN